MLIENDRLREAVLDSGVSLYLIALRMGSRRTPGGRHYQGHACTARVRRALGISPNYRNGRAYLQARVHVDTAATICRAAGLDPVDVGL